MQPTSLQPIGYFSHHRNLPSSSSVTFNSLSTKACLCTCDFIELYQLEPYWSKLFTWSQKCLQSLKLPVSQHEVVGQWVCSGAQFVNAQQQTTGLVEDALYIILTNEFRDASLICYFPNATRADCSFVVCMHGIIKSWEWLPTASPHHHFDEGEHLSDTMDLSAVAKKPSTSVSQRPLVTGVFSGCIALGFQLGFTGLLDLCLDWSREDSGSPVYGSAVGMERIQLLQHVSSGTRVSSFDNTDTSACEHSLVYFDSSVVRWNEFHYKSVNGKLLNKLPSAGVYVSVLRHIPNSHTLVVGFSFGGWQLWSLTTMEVEFSLRHSIISAPVCSVTFQEPSDDPRYCCYLWIGWQSDCNQTDSENEGKSSQLSNAQAKLYQLVYANRTEVPGANVTDPTYTYQHLIGLSERLSTVLSTDHQTSLPNHLLSIQPINKGLISDQSQPTGTHLAAVIWRRTSNLIRVGLFDLDRWYHAQMPTHIRSDNAFFAVFDASTRTNDTFIINGHVIASSILSYWSEQTARTIQLSAIWEPCILNKPAHDSTHHCTSSTSIYGANSAIPVPEVCLRPSSLSLSLQIGWINQSLACHTGGGIANVQYASRQESCFLMLDTILSSHPHPDHFSRFEVIDWLSEAWMAGLLESSGLDFIDEDDLDRNLSLSRELMVPRMERGLPMDESELETIGFKFAYGDDSQSLNIIDQLKELVTSTNACLSRNLDRPSKRLKTTDGSSDTQSQEQSDRIILCPAWVLFANCLLEHGHFQALRSINQLAEGYGAYSPEEPKFRLAWLWLRFGRIKGRFDRLTAPAFSTSSTYHLDKDCSAISRSFTSDLLNYRELGATLSQIKHLNQLAQHWFGAHDSDKSADACPHQPLCDAIQSFSDYANLLALLSRIGVLPQSNLPEDFLDQDSLDLSYKMLSKSLLLVYHPSLIGRVIERLQSSSGPEDEDRTDDRTLSSISMALLKSTLQSTDNASHVWCEHEDISSEDQISYPPRRLQSLCVLWQIPICSAAEDSFVRARLALLCFILFDTTAAATFMKQSASSGVSSDVAGQNMVPSGSPFICALKRCRRLVMLLVKQLPLLQPLLVTILVLWLLDRGLFEEAISRLLVTFVTGQTSFKLINIIPDQTEILANLLKSKQPPNSSNSSQDFLHRFANFYNLPDLLKLVSDTSPTGRQSIDLRSTGAPLLALYKLRRCLDKLRHRRVVTLNEGRRCLSDTVEQVGQRALIELAESCRSAGRLGDLFNLGLMRWEAETLCGYYKDTGQHQVLFYLLLARRRYKEALSIYREYHRDLKHRISPSSFVEGRRGMDKLDCLAEILSGCLPVDEEEILLDLSVPKLASLFSTDPSATCPTHHSSASPEAIFYPRAFTVQCPMTVDKLPTTKSRKRTHSSVSLSEVEDENLDLYSPVDPNPLRTSKLLETAKKSSNEFWETFDELEKLRLSCNIRSTWTHSLSSIMQQSPAGLNQSKRRSAHLFKLIYTPPARRPTKAGLTLSDLEESELRTVAHSKLLPRPSLLSSKPVSILKSPACRSSALNFKSTSEDFRKSDSRRAVLLPPHTSVDADVTLNLSTVRPSLTGLPIFQSDKSSTTKTPSQITKISDSDDSEAIENSFESNPCSETYRPATTPSNPVLPTNDSTECNSPMNESETSIIAKVAEEVAVTGNGTDEDDMDLTTVAPIESDSLQPSVELTSIDQESAMLLTSLSTPPSPQTGEEETVHTANRSASLHCKSSPTEDNRDAGQSSIMDLDDTLSVTSSLDEISFTRESVRRSTRRIRAPNRFDPSRF